MTRQTFSPIHSHDNAWRAEPTLRPMVLCQRLLERMEHGLVWRALAAEALHSRDAPALAFQDRGDALGGHATVAFYVLVFFKNLGHIFISLLFNL